MTILLRLLLPLLLLTLPISVSAEDKEPGPAGQYILPQPPAKACSATPGGQLSCGMLLVLGGILDKEDGLQMLEFAARNGDRTAMAALYTIHARGSHGVPKDAARAQYWARLGGINTRNCMAGKANMAGRENGPEDNTTNMPEPTQTPCGHSDAHLNTLERKAVAGDEVAGDLLFDLHMRGRYAPCPEVEMALAKRGLMTKAGMVVRKE